MDKASLDLIVVAGIVLKAAKRGVEVVLSQSGNDLMWSICQGSAVFDEWCVGDDPAEGERTLLESVKATKTWIDELSGICARSEPTNKTAQDARNRLSDAKTGSLAGEPSVEYIEELRVGLYDWVSNVNDELANRTIKLQRERAARRA